MKETLKTLKWIFNHSIPSLPYLLLTSLLSGLLSIIGIFSTLISKAIIDAATSNENSLVIKWLIVMAIFYLLRIIVSSVNSIATTYLSTTLFNRIQKKLYQSLTFSQWLEQSKYHSVNLLTRLTHDVSTVSNVITSSLSGFISLSVTLISAFITLLYLDSFIAIFTIIATPVYLLFSRLYSRKLKSIYKEVQEQDIDYRTFIQESIQNFLIVKAFCHEEENFKTLDIHHQTRLNLKLKSTTFSLFSNLFFGSLSFFIYFIVYSISALKLASNQLTFGSMTALIQLYYKVSGPISGFASIARQFIEAIAAAERLIELENLPKEEAYDFIPSSSKSYNITFKKVSFQYDQQPILKQESLSFKSNQINALVGPSGQGKTTIVNLILSLIYPNSGEILINYEPLTQSHRKLISYVPQGNTLFSGTIKENICYGYKEANDDEIIEAAKLAQAYEFIKKLDDQFNTLIGEKGLGLSEGQAQRIALARAFLSKKPILVLDEATSALDEQTEINILNGIKNLPHQPTCILITHRLKALPICDHVINLNKGATSK